MSFTYQCNLMYSLVWEWNIKITQFAHYNDISYTSIIFGPFYLYAVGSRFKTLSGLKLKIWYFLVDLIFPWILYIHQNEYAERYTTTLKEITLPTSKKGQMNLLFYHYFLLLYSQIYWRTYVFKQRSSSIHYLRENDPLNGSRVEAKHWKLSDTHSSN